MMKNKNRIKEYKRVWKSLKMLKCFEADSE